MFKNLAARQNAAGVGLRKWLGDSARLQPVRNYHAGHANLTELFRSDNAAHMEESTCDADDIPPLARAEMPIG